MHVSLFTCDRIVNEPERFFRSHDTMGETSDGAGDTVAKSNQSLLFSI